MTPEDLKLAIAQAIEAAAQEDGLDIAVPDKLTVERPKNRDHGDWAANTALQLAKQAGIPPRELAEKLAARLRDNPGIDSIDIAGPGFLNITLNKAAAGQLALSIVEAGEAYGTSNALAGAPINMEFVSANPTGPLHLGHTRWAAVGDALTRVLRAAGGDVTAEYYINDFGSQMDTFAGSVLARLRGREVPEGGYPGQYVQTIADALLERHPEWADASDDDILLQLKAEAYELQMDDIKETLQAFGVHFDVFFSEKTLHDEGKVEDAVTRLREQGHIFEDEGAVWLRTTDFGDDKNRVLVRADGAPTYFAADAAYYLSKRDRGFDKKIYLLGADHHGYVGRLKALAATAGDDPEENIEILIGQLISVNGARLSKRAGNIIELRDLIVWLGADALRYSLARIPTDSPLTLDPEVLRSASNDNPVYYVQYAHARACSVERRAVEAGVESAEVDPATLTHETEATLLSALADFPRVVADAASLREPHRVARYLESLAGSFHKWYDACRVVPRADEDLAEVHATRLVLDRATKTVLANGLRMLGVSAPEKM